jgi:predicted dehydrogenase
MATIKAGIIGTGFIGPAHIEAARRLGYVEMLALAENGDALAQSKAQQLHIPRAYGSVDALLADPDVQVVHNCTPNHLHFEVTKKILAAGKHVISEKPLAMTAAESKELVQLAEAAGVVHAIDFNYRYYPLVQQMRAMVAHGDLGDVYHATGSYTQDWLYLNTDWNWRLQPEMSGNSRAIADIGSHWMDCLQFVTGQKIVRVQGHLHTVHKERMKPKKEVETYSGKLLTAEDYEPQPISTEDFATVMFELENGGVGSYTVSQVFAGRKNRLFIEIAGSKGSVVWDQEEPNELKVGYREKPNLSFLKDPSLLHPEARGYAHYPGGHPEAYPDGLKNFLAQVYSYIAEPREAKNFSTFEDGHYEMALVDAILESGKSGAWVDVKA